MKQCKNCKATLEEDAVFCPACGTKYGDETQSQEEKSLFLKYANYLDAEALYKVAWAKEQGIVKSEIPNEAEILYKMLAMKGHHGSMFRYAMLLIQKSEMEEAKRWLQLSASQGYVESINYLKTMMPEVQLETNAGKREAVVVERAPTPAPAPVTVPLGNALSGEAVFEKMDKSVVEIYATEAKQTAYSSGFIVSSKGFVLTNAHAITNNRGEPYQKIVVQYKGEAYDAQIVAFGKPADGKHDNLDLALLFIPGLNDASAVDFGQDNSYRNGNKVYLIGNSLGNGTCITSGIISDATRAMPGLSYPYIMTDAAANHGNSGGPLVNENGEVIGVLVAGVQNAEGMNYAIPVDMAKEFLAHVITSMKLPQQALGELSEQTFTSLSVKEKISACIEIVIDTLSVILKVLAII